MGSLFRNHLWAILLTTLSVAILSPQGSMCDPQGTRKSLTRETCRRVRSASPERSAAAPAPRPPKEVRINIKRWVSMSLASPTYRTDAENAAGAAPGDVAPQLARALRALVRLARARLRLAAAERRGAAAAPPSAEEPEMLQTRREEAWKR